MTTEAPTPTYVYTMIVTATMTEFDTLTSTDVVTSTQTEIDTVATTTTSTTVAITTPAGVNDCTGTSYHTGTYGVNYQQMCGMSCNPSANPRFDLGTDQATFTDCIVRCSELNSVPNLVVYNIDTSYCVCWTSFELPDCQADAAYDSAYAYNLY